ncbi:Spermatogenesis-associated protein 4 [Tetrabaena socialis]|uniref:Spermatogenesis-associated protein 4 n=1 Tax=Tetrabaena socialis TaxID=47790 RepID=A0A2J8A5W2_9CHLO|nr:Spermatogenesis-associated protein 4 [Tetrabaena socialis]|eukprot:PNH07890.1 Spermatogenesis-associated protein 4 [Tetrabaena socialis]
MTNRTLSTTQAAALASTTGRRGTRLEDTTVFGYESPPDTPALHRDVFKWVQSLDLSQSLKNCRRDVANGFLVAEVFARYFPTDIQMHSFANATSSHFKRDNWAQLQTFCGKQGISLPADLVEGTVQGLHGAAIALLEHLYESFTGKKVPRIKVPDAAAAAAAAAARGGAGAASVQDGARLISSQAKTAQNLEFGQVTTQQVAGDALTLRRRLAAGSTS